MKFIAFAVLILGTCEAGLTALGSVGRMGFVPEGFTEEDLHQWSYWLGALPFLLIVCVLMLCATSVTVFPVTPRQSFIRTGSLIGFAVLHAAFVIFAVWVGFSADNVAMFGYAAFGAALFVCAALLLRVRPRRPTRNVAR